LIEVTFANLRLVEARDVSAFAREYFAEQLTPEVVGQTIDQHR
jgi:hypothetical protein